MYTRKIIQIHVMICKSITNKTIQDSSQTDHWAAEYNSQMTTYSHLLAICHQRKSNSDIIMRIVHVGCCTG